jgi:hypothetical protein
VRKTVKWRKEEEEKLQKSKARELKAAATLYKKKMAREAKALRQIAKVQHEQERKAKADELATAHMLKKQQCEAATPQKSHNTLNTGKQAASQNAALESTKK